jgi:1,5-anhydro-D-fructose reductase (1,5-anhydro-D-mannitol-forming)
MVGTNTVRWGVLGSGRIVASRFVPAARRSGRAEVVACAGRDQARTKAFAAQHQIPRVHADLASLLAEDGVDAIYIATPNSLHGEQAMEALRAGKHVLCEKPLATSVAAARELATFAATSGCQLKVGYQFRFEPLLSRIRDLVKEGVLGEVRSVTLLGTSAGAPPTPWRNSAAEGGVLSDLGVHLIDLVRFCSGLEFEELAAVATPKSANQPIQAITMVGRLTGDAQVSIRTSRELKHGANFICVEGRQGSLVSPAWRNVDGAKLYRDVDGQAGVETIPSVDLFERELQAFADEVAGIGSDLATAEDGVRSAEIAEAAMKSAESPLRRV